MQAALGLAQIKKLPAFIEQRKKNFSKLKKGLSTLSAQLLLPEPTAGTNPSWFGFLIALKPDAGITRKEFI